ncbi:MAG: hypothetical protein ABI867_08270 [Kofleriaceae bacterium]
MRAVWVALVMSVTPAYADVMDRLPPPPPPPPEQPAPEPEPEPLVVPLPTAPSTGEHTQQEHEGQMLRTPIRPREIVIDVPGERTRNQKILIGSLLGTGAIAGAIGLYFHLDSRDAADSVSASQPTGEAWSDDDQALVERGARSRTRAAIGYSIGGAFMIGTIVSLIITSPKPERNVIRPHFAVNEHGGILGGAWVW